MAVREIKTSITLDGEQQFRQAIAAANKELRVSQSELKAVASAYDLSGDRMTMLANKQRSLGDMVNQQENITNALRRNLKELEQAYERAGRGVEEYRDKLRQAETSGNEQEIESATKALRQAEAAYERAGKKVADYRIQVNNAEDKLNRFKRSAQDVDREIEELGRDSVKAGRQIEDGIGDSAEAAEKDVRSLVKTLQDDLSSIRASTTFTAIGSLWDMATDAYSAVDGFVQSTMDYRRQLSYLEMNAEESGFGFDVIKNKLIETQAMTADASSAMEGLSNLLQIEGLNESQLTHAMEGLLGASIKWQETLKFESLADSLQETLATGKAVGAYAELLERLGYNLDDFNAILDKGELPADDIEAALAVLDAKEITEAYQQYKENNAELIRELETVARLEMASARIGEIVSRNITTPIKSKFTDILDWIADEMTKFENDPEAYAEELPGRVTNALAETADKTTKSLGLIIYKQLAPDYSALVNRYEEEGKTDAANAVEEVVSRYYGAKALSVIFDENARSEWMLDLFKRSKPALPGIVRTYGNAMYETPAGPPTEEQYRWQEEKKWLESTFAAGKYDMPVGQWKTVAFNRATDAQLAVKKAVDNLFSNWVSPEKAEEAGEEAATSFLDGWETMVIRPDLAQEAEGFLTDEQGNAIKPIGIRENWEEYLKTITDMVPQYEDAGEEAGAATAKAFGAELDAAAAQAKLAGATAALNFGAGLSSQVSYVAAQAGVLAAAASARLSSSRGGGTVNVALNIDGRQVATALAPYNDEVMAVTFDGTTPFQMR